MAWTNGSLVTFQCSYKFAGCNQLLEIKVIKRQIINQSEGIIIIYLLASSNGEYNTLYKQHIYNIEQYNSSDTNI